MGNEPVDKSNLDLFLANKKDIAELAKKVENLMVEDLGLKHQMDILTIAFKDMKIGFDHSRETGFKTFEAVQKISSEIGKVTSKVEKHDGDLIDAKKALRDVNKRVDRFLYSSLIGVIITLVGGVIFFLWNWRLFFPGRP